MFGLLFYRIFPRYEARAWLKESRDFWRADARRQAQKVRAAENRISELESELKSIRLDFGINRDLATSRAKEIEYFQVLTETMAKTIARLRAAACVKNESGPLFRTSCDSCRFARFL